MAEPHAEGASGAERDHGLKRLVAAVLPMLVHVQPREVARVAEAAETDGGSAEAKAEDGRAEEVAELRPRHEEQRERQEQEHDGAPEILLRHAEEHEEPRHEEVGEEADCEVLHLLGLLRERVGEPDDERELCDFGGLDVDGADGDPSGRAAGGVPEADDARDAEEPRHDEQRVRELVEPVVVDAADAEESDERSDCVRRLALEEELRVVVLHRRLNRRRAVDHHDAEADERDRDRREHWVHRGVRQPLIYVRVEGSEQDSLRTTTVPLRLGGGGAHRGELPAPTSTRP